MEDNFLTFRTFNKDSLVTDLVTRLKDNNIPYEVEDSSNFYDPSMANNTVLRRISIKIISKDFTKAQELLDNYYESILDKMPTDYYLFTFSDKELMEILIKPDEWGDLDYQLSQKILKDRGINIDKNNVALMKQVRNDELSKPETLNKYIVILGYVSAFLGGLFGIAIGLYLNFSKRTIPDGRSVFTYSLDQRKQGKNIIIISIIFFIIYFIQLLFTLNYL